MLNIVVKYSATYSQKSEEVKADTGDQGIFDFLMSSQEGEASLFASMLRIKGK